MIERLIEEYRRTITITLIVLVGITLALWLIRGPRPVLGNVPFLAVSMLLTPLGYFGVYILLYLGSRPGQIPYRILRTGCDLIFLGAVFFLVVSAAIALREFANYRIIPPPNFLALGMALGAMRGWGPWRTSRRSTQREGE